MNYAFPCGHPTHIASIRFALVALEVLMIETSFDVVEYSVESSMRMLWESCRQFDFGHVKKEERIKVSEDLAADDSEYVGSIAFDFPVWFEYGHV